MIGRRSLLLAGAALPASVSAYGQCVTDTMVVDACLGGVRRTVPGGMSLNLNFMSAPIDPRITFTRVSTATYTDATGTIQTAAINAPRWDYDPVTHVLRGLLIEEARTNVAFPSIPVGSWSINGSTPTANSGIAPDGTNTMVKLIDDGTNGIHCSVNSFTIVTGQPYTFSAYAKAGEIRYLGFRVDQGTPAFGAVFDLQAGVISNPANSEGAGTVSGATMQAVGNGIYRCTLSGNLGANTTARCCLINMITPTGTGFVTYQGVSGNGSYVWGVQYEQGALTSYIPTTATAVTRAVDRCGIASANMAPWFVSTVGSWFAEFVGLVPSPNNACIIAEPGTTFAGKKPVTVLSTTNFALGQYDGAGIVSTPNATTANVVARTVSTWTAGQAKAVLNGGAVATSATLTLGYSSLATNGVNFLTPASLASSDNLTGYIRRVQYWPRALSDTEMQQVTT